MKFMRIVLSLLLLVIIVAGVALASLYYFIDPNKLKPIMAEQIRQHTGYEVVIDGNFTWSLYPRVGIKVAHIALYAPKRTAPFVELRDITFATELGELLRGKQKLRGDVYIDELSLLNVKGSHAHVGLGWQAGVLTLSPMTASLYDGSMSGSIRGRNLAMQPTWDWEVDFDHVQLEPLLLDMNGADNKLNIAARAQVKFRGLTYGKTRDDMLGNLDGTLALLAKDGSVTGLNINYLIESANAFMTRQPIAAPDQINKTMFDSLNGAMVIHKGIVETKQLILDAPAFVAKASGSINLPYNAINIQLMVTPNNNAKVNWQVPVMLTGNLDRPDVRLDTSELTKLLAQQEIKKIKSKVREEVKERIPGKAGEYLQELLSN